ncbi:MAG: acyl-CoA dehydrogenase, partial [Bacteroidota bacterium]
GAEFKAVSDFKKAILMVVGAAAKAQMDGKLNLKEEQEIIMNVADMLADLINTESTLLRLQKLRDNGKGRLSQNIYDAILQVLFHDANARLAKNGLDAVASFTEGELLTTFTAGIRRFTQYPPRNVKALRRIVADHLIANNEYSL